MSVRPDSGSRLASDMKKQLIDQAAHIAAAMAALAPAAFIGGVLGFALSGLFCGLIREITQHGGFSTGRGSLLDLAFWTVGGVIIGLIGG